MISKMEFLTRLASRKEVFVSIDSMPDGSEELAEALLRQGLVGIERAKDGSIFNVIITRVGLSKVLGRR